MSRCPAFSSRLLQWYEVHKRSLPWRESKDPYEIWISEIILQQTRVDQGMAYYLRFIQQFPNALSLAEAEEKDVLKLWQGLGYYSRARNLHAAAKTILTEYKGHFPESYLEIKSLRGIGDYTAAAIASFAFKLAYPVIDGNVIRVISRLYGIDSPIQASETKKAIQKIAEELIDKTAPDTYNQAIMEFGALQCTPHNPSCENCIFNMDCIAFNTGRVSELPKKKKVIKKRHRYFDYAVMKLGEKFILKKRTDKDIWENMYDFPLLENTQMPDSFALEQIFTEDQTSCFSPVFEKTSTWKTHILSHQKIHARFHEYRIKECNTSLPENWEITELDKIENYPVPKLIEHYLNGL